MERCGGDRTLQQVVWQQTTNKLPRLLSSLNIHELRAVAETVERAVREN